MKKYFSVLFIAFLGLLLSACTIDFQTSINADESGEFRVVLEFDDDEVGEVEDIMDDSGYGNDPEEWCEYLEDQLIDSSLDFLSLIDMSYEENRDNYSCIFALEFDDLDELEMIYIETEWLAVDRLRMNRDGGLDYQIVGYFDFVSEADFEDEGAEVELDYSWSVTVPGNVIDHDGDELNGRTIVWNIRPDREMEMQFESAPGGFALPDLGLPVPTWTILLFCLCCLFLLVIIVVLILFMRRRKKKSA